MTLSAIPSESRSTSTKSSCDLCWTFWKVIQLPPISRSRLQLSSVRYFMVFSLLLSILVNPFRPGNERILRRHHKFRGHPRSHRISRPGYLFTHSNYCLSSRPQHFL